MTTTDAPVTVEQCDRDRAAGTTASFQYRESILAGEQDTGRLVQAFARHRLAALASAPAGHEVRHGLGPHALVFEDDADGFAPVAILRGGCVYIQQREAQITLSPDVADRLAAALAHPPAAVGERAWAGVVATNPRQSADDTDEDGNPCWYIEIQSVGGHSVVATIYGGSPKEVQSRADAILALQSPPAKVEG